MKSRLNKEIYLMKDNQDKSIHSNILDEELAQVAGGFEASHNSGALNHNGFSIEGFGKFCNPCLPSLDRSLHRDGVQRPAIVHPDGLHPVTTHPEMADSELPI